MTVTYNSSTLQPYNVKRHQLTNECLKTLKLHVGLQNISLSLCVVFEIGLCARGQTDPQTYKHKDRSTSHYPAVSRGCWLSADPRFSPTTSLFTTTVLLQ